jgi:hypothetical protein
MPAYINRFYSYSMVDRQKQFMYIPVYKNATNKFRQVFEDNRWVELHRVQLNDQERTAFFKNIVAFSFLRDPYERWISGFTTFILTKDQEEFNQNLFTLVHTDYHQDALELFFKLSVTFEFDVHTKLQCKYFDSSDDVIDINRVVFFKLNEKTGYNLNKFFQSNKMLMPINNSVVNAISQNYYAQVVYGRVVNFFNANPDIKQKLMHYLEPDYKFIETVNFYND